MCSLRPLSARISYNGKGIFICKEQSGKGGKSGKKKGRKKGKRKRKRKGKKNEKKRESKVGKRKRAGKRRKGNAKSEMEKSRKLFAATRLTLGFLGTNFFTFIIMKNYIVGKGVLFL